MNTALLLQWLGLPPGPWPPDDRTLLGLPPGPIDPVAAELRALALMEQLRPHQLVNPDLVTEGMNRLAQALIAATAAPAAPFFPEVRLEPDPPPAPPRPVRTKPATEAGPKILDAEVIRTAEIVDAEVVTVAPAAPRIAKALPAAAADAVPAPAPIPADFPPIPDGPPPPDRRAAYRELAALRVLRRAWDAVRPSVGVASNPLLTPADVCEFFEGVRQVRAALRLKDLPPLDDDSPGRAVRAVARHPLPLAVMRQLIPTQRQALAWDWATGDAAIRHRAAGIRAALKRSRPGRSPRQKVAAATRWVGRNPECWLAAATVLALVAAGVRVLAG